MCTSAIACASLLEDERDCELGPSQPGKGPAPSQPPDDHRCGAEPSQDEQDCSAENSYMVVYKVFIYLFLLVEMLDFIYYYCYFIWPQGMWDLSFRTRDRICNP